MGLCASPAKPAASCELAPMIDDLMQEEAPATTAPPARIVLDWKIALRSELDRAIVRGAGRWSRALVAVGCVHFLAFVVCHCLQSPSRHSDPRHILVWFAELVAVFAALRVFAGKGWLWSPQAIHLVARLWLTLLVLSFSLATLNAIIGWETLWFKAAWGTLSSFFFAALAWLITPRFLVLAVWMYITALLMARFMDYNNLIYGTSWWLVLLVIAGVVRQRERGGARDAIGR
jgi:hypothetical protein